ncbi:MAG: sensor histidine kinase [Elainellaceae cyanobacterium]
MAKKGFRGRFSRWSLDQKICAGYGASFLLAIAGITTSFLVSQQTRQATLDSQAEAIEDVGIVSDLKGSLLELAIHNQPAVGKNWDNATDAEISAAFSHLAEDYQEFKQNWQTLRQSEEFNLSRQRKRDDVTAAEAAAAAQILRDYEGAIADYINQFDALLEKIYPNAIEAKQIPLLQAELIALNQGEFLTNLDDFLDQIAALSEAAREEQAQSLLLLQRTHGVQILVMLASIVLSMALGLALMQWISRTLCRPLRDMTYRTQQSIRNANLGLQVPIISHDEVGVLAQALNGYSKFTDQLLRQHQEINEKLTQTLEELNQAQLKMVQQEKMSSLGRLVAGIAHEINNPTTFIYSNLTYIQKYTQDLLDLVDIYQRSYATPALEVRQKVQEIDLSFIQDDLPKVLASIEMGGERICDIVQSLRNFSRIDESETKVADVHRGLNDTLVILGHRLKASPEHPRIQVVRDYTNVPPVECYPGLLNQVFINIISNAIDAIEDKAAALTYEESLDYAFQIVISTAMFKENWIDITIFDNGLGIARENQTSIFDPFFTTKPIGKGTGMGLSISYQIIAERHKGELEFCSDPDSGTKFTIRIPVRLLSAIPTERARVSHLSLAS